MSYFQLRGYFIKQDGVFYATIPSLDLSKVDRSLDIALELIIKSLAEHKINSRIILIEGNGFTVEASDDTLEKFVLHKKCS